MLNEGIKTFTANGAIAAHTRVKLTTGSATIPPQVETAGAGEQHIGIAEYAAATTTLVAIRLRTYPGTHECVASEAVEVGDPLYAAANGMIKDTSDGTCIGIAIEAATAANDIVEFIDFTVISTTAAGISIADAGSFTASATAEAAFAEIYQDLLSTTRILNLPIFGWQGTAGVALAAFSDGDSAVPGYCVTAEGYGIRWNNKSTHGNIIQTVVLPSDFNEAANAVLHIIAAKVGATVGDATKFTVTAFNNVVAALYDADSDFGGDTGAMTGDATSKTVQHVTLTLALANLTAYPATMQLTIQPKNTTLATDDVIVFGTWIEYKRKLLTS